MTHLARNGIPSMMAVAKKLCQLIVKFTPILTVQYPSNAALLAALAAANAACAALSEELAPLREYSD